MKSKEEILLERERAGLRFILAFRLLLLLGFAGGTLLLGQSRFEIAVGLPSLSIMAVFCFLQWQWLRARRRLRFVGISGAIMDSLLLLAMPFLWHASVGGEAVSRAYVLKANNIQVVSFAALIIHSLANRPLYPLIITLGVFVSNAAYFAFAIVDTRTIITDDLREHVLGAGFTPGIWGSYLLTFAVCGAALALFLRRNRNTMLQAVQAERQNDQIARYFSPGVFRAISGAGDEFFRVGGRRQPVAVLFADIRGFTAMSDRLAPEEITRLLSDYHSRMLGAIFRHGGTLDKFIGDGIMATFGTPIPGPHDTLNAVRAGLAMKTELEIFNAARLAAGAEMLRQGIGIHCGEAIVGNIGTPERLEFTVIGDVVNVASRVESACKITDADFLITAAVRERLDGDIRSADIGDVVLPGKAQPMRLYSVVGWDKA